MYAYKLHNNCSYRPSPDDPKDLDFEIDEDHIPSDFLRADRAAALATCQRENMVHRRDVQACQKAVHATALHQYVCASRGVSKASSPGICPDVWKEERVITKR